MVSNGMKLTKYEHACFTVEEQRQKVMVDPGVFTNLPEDISGIVAVVITHKHPDHFNPEHLDKIKTANPNVVFYGSKEVAAEYPAANEPARSHKYQAGPFELVFYGEMHEMIRPGYPQVSNLGVAINGTVAYPGDSFTQLGKRLKVMMTPASAPWLHVRDATAFIANAQAELIIPTHDAMLSEIGHQIYGAHYQATAESAGSTYRRLAVGESIEL